MVTLSYNKDATARLLRRLTSTPEEVGGCNILSFIRGPKSRVRRLSILYFHYLSWLDFVILWLWGLVVN